MARAATPFMVRLFFGVLKPKRQVLGSEFAGIIEGVGEGVTDWQPGMRVCGATDLNFGAHADYVIQSGEGTMVEVPDDVPMDSAAVLAFGGLTVLHFLRDVTQITTGNEF